MGKVKESVAVYDVEIPENRRLTIEVPREVPTGKTILTFTPASSTADAYKAVTTLRGLAKRMGSTLTVERFHEMQQEDLHIEEESKKVIPLLALRGSCKGIDTIDAYFTRKRADKAFEDGLVSDNPYKVQEK